MHSVHLNKGNSLLLPTASSFAPAAPASGWHWLSQDCLDQFPTNPELSATCGHSKKRTRDAERWWVQATQGFISHPTTDIKSNTAIFHPFVKLQNGFQIQIPNSAMCTGYGSSDLLWNFLSYLEYICALWKHICCCCCCWEKIISQQQFYLICAPVSENMFLWGEKKPSTFIQA